MAYTYHVNLPSGGMATVSSDASPKLLNALDKMVELAKEMPDTKGEISEEIMQWINEHPDAEYVSIPGKYIGYEPTYWRGVMHMYRTKQEEIVKVIGHAEAGARVAMEWAAKAADKQSEIATLTKERDEALEHAAQWKGLATAAHEAFRKVQEERDNLQNKLDNNKSAK